MNTAFSSTYAREIAYDDERWKSRLLNPLVTTLIATTSTNDIGQNQENKPKVLSSTTVVGPMAAPPELPRKAQHSNEDQPTPAPLVWEINAVWTAPEARRHGIARHLMREATRQVQVFVTMLCLSRELRRGCHGAYDGC